MRTVLSGPLTKSAQRFLDKLLGRPRVKPRPKRKGPPVLTPEATELLERLKCRPRLTTTIMRKGRIGAWTLDELIAAGYVEQGTDGRWRAR